jgi:hypothetical protein
VHKANSRMQELMQALDRRSEALPASLLDLMRGGFLEAKTCVFRASLYRHRGNATLTSFPDETGYECFVNHIQIDEHVPQDAWLRVGLLFVDRLIQTWRASARASMPIQAILSIGEWSDYPSHTVRFHVVRHGQDWLTADLESYEHEAVLAVRTDDQG